MLKKLTAIILLVTMILITFPLLRANADDTPTFKDIENHWAKDAIEAAVVKGYITGYPDGTFRPGDRVKTDEFISMMIRSLTEKTPQGRVSWSKSYVDRLEPYSQNELFLTMDEFDPNNIPKTKYWADPYLDQAERMLFFNRKDKAWGGKYNIQLTREKAAYLVLGLITWYEHRENSAFADLSWKAIKDAKEVSYKEHVIWAFIKGIMRGYPDGTFKPKGYITRAEAVIIINRILDDAARDPYMPDLTGKYYKAVTTTQGKTMYYVFPSKDFITLFDALDKVKDTPPGYLEDKGIELSYYTSKEEYDKMMYEMLRGNYNIEYPDVMTLGLGSSDTNFGIGINSAMSFKGYEKVYDAFVKTLFGDKADQFNKAFMDKLAERKKNGTIKPVDLVINGREIRITEAGKAGVAASISSH